VKKIFVFSLPGVENKLLVADNQEEAFERRGEVDPAYEYLPVNVSELEIEGFDIHAKPKTVKPEEPEEPGEPVPSQPEITLDKPPEKPKQTKSKAKQSKK
jgi:hypothetical protein